MRGPFKRARPAKQPLNVNEAIEEVVLLTRGEGLRNQVPFQLELAVNLPLVMADRVQIQQVVMNLILNGIQAMSAVSDRGRVLTIKTERVESNKILEAVQDCGIGIDSGDIERVFAAFHTTKPNGMGMGLSISPATMAEAISAAKPAFAALLDGFDLLAIGAAAPAMAIPLHIAPNHIGILFSAALFGLMLGAFGLGPVR
jgi:phosphoglycerate-specific signal transduction histidine kinase